RPGAPRTEPGERRPRRGRGGLLRPGRPVDRLLRARDHQFPHRPRSAATVSPDLPGADDITRRAPTPRTADRLAVGFHRGTVRSGNRGTVRVRRLLVGQDLRAVEVPRAEATRVRRPESGRLQMTP